MSSVPFPVADGGKDIVALDDAALVALKQWQVCPTMSKAYVRSRSERRYSVRKQVQVRAVEAYGMTPASGGIACDIHIHLDFHHQLRGRQA